MIVTKVDLSVMHFLLSLAWRRGLICSTYISIGVERLVVALGDKVGCSVKVHLVGTQLQLLLCE